MTHAIILAAGRGIRLYPYTKDTPKCLLPIRGKTLIERLVIQLRKSGISETTVVVGYQEDKVKSALKSMQDAGISFVRNEEYAATNTLYSLLKAEGSTRGDAFILIDGDIVCEDGVLSGLVGSEHTDALLVDMRHGTGKEEVKVKTNDVMRVMRLGKDIGPADCEFTGISKLSSEGAKILFNRSRSLTETERRSLYYDDLMDRCSGLLEIFAVPVGHHRWVEIDYVVDYLDALESFSGYKKEMQALTGRKRLPVLLTPGPVMLSEKTRMALLHPDICHREQEFSEVLTRIRYNLLSLYGTSNNHRYSCVILTGSGSAANECVLSSTSPMVKKVLVVSNGEFGERLANIADKYTEKDHLRYRWGQAVRAADVERRLASDADLGMVCMVHHETSTGMLNPISQVGAIAKRQGRLFFVDAISSLGAETVDVERNGITFCTSAPNKAIGAPPGLSFVCGERSVLERLGDFPSPTSYLDLSRHYQYEEHLMQTPHTPAVHLFFALDAALSEALRDGLEERARRYGRLAKMLRDGLKELGLSSFIPEALMSRVLTTVNLPTGIDPETLHDRLRERGYIVYLGKGELKQKAFQVANMGAISEREVAGFLRALGSTLRELMLEVSPRRKADERDSERQRP